MVTKKDIDALEAFTNDYFMKSERIGFQIENRQEELEGIVKAYSGMRLSVEKSGTFSRSISSFISS